MRTLLLSLCVIAISLQGCGNDKGTPQTQGDKNGTIGSPGGDTKPGEQGKLPESQRLFMASAEKLQKGDPKGCEELLNQASEAALKEKDDVDYIHIKETHAKLRLQQNDRAGAKKILEDQMARYEKSTDQRVVSRMDGVRYLLAKLYSIEGQKDKADALFKNFELRMDQAAAVAKKSKDWPNYLQVREAQARLKADRNENVAAMKILEEEIKQFSKPGAPQDIAQRVDLFKMLRISLIAKTGKPADAEKEYKALIAEARGAKPIDHRKLAFALHEYAEFLKYTKRTAEAEKVDTEAKAELDKSGSKAPS